MVATVPRVANTKPRMRTQELKKYFQQLLLPDFFKYIMYITEGRIIIMVEAPTAPVIPSTVPRFLKTMAMTSSRVRMQMVTTAIIQYSRNDDEYA